MSMRKIHISDEMWEYKIGTSGIGIIDPRNGKKYNVKTKDFSFVSGVYVNDHEAITPSDVRNFINIAYRGIGTAPIMCVDIFYGSKCMNVWSSLHKSEVIKHVKENFADFIIDSEEPPVKCKVLPESHVHYRFKKLVSVESHVG